MDGYPPFEYKWKKEQYSLQAEMIQWCLDEVGPGRWTLSGLHGEGELWGCWWCLGMGGFTFGSEKDFKRFSDKWKMPDSTGVVTTSTNTKKE